MRSFLFCSFAIITACSTLDPLEESPFDEEVGCDTAAENTADDSGTGTDDAEIDDSGIEDEVPVCEFEVDTWDGEVVMGNTLSVELGQQGPGGASELGLIEVLRLEFRVDDPECEALTINGFTLMGYWTDKAQTGWTPSNLQLVTFVGADYWTPAITNHGTVLYAGFSEMGIEIDAGNGFAIALYADMSNASAEFDDEAQFSLYLDSLGVSDQTSTRVLKNDWVTGATLVF